jgi:hypothetical protein
VKEIDHEYHILDDKIAYMGKDEYLTGIFKGYITTFAYFKEN